MVTTAAVVAAGASAASAASAMSNKPKTQAANTVNIDQLIEQANANAENNARRSVELERTLTPEVSALRTKTIQDLLGYTREDNSPTGSTALQQQLANQFYNLPSGGDLSLLERAAQVADADLATAGQIPLDVRNAIARSAAARSASVSGGGLGLGRDLTARDLGLTSLDLRNRALSNALQAGGAFYNAGQGNANDYLANRLNLVNGITGLGNQDFSRQLALAQLGQAIQRPEVGLDSGSIANLAVGNSNSQNQTSALNQAARAQWLSGMQSSLGSLAGTAGGLAAAYGTSTSGSNPYGIDQSKNGAYNDMAASMNAASGR